MSKYLQWSSLGLIILAAFLLMFNASLQESATMDELAHIPAGYSYVRYLDYRLNPEHPPLVKALAALPLLFQSFGSAQDKLKFPTDKASWKTDINGQWAAGAQFLYESGNDADQIIQWSRVGPILLTLLLIIFIYVWAKELIGRWWALLPSFLFAFSPTVLAHGHYVTTDIGAALGIFIAAYYFVKFLFEPSGRHLIFAGLAFGVAQLMKFSAVLLIPFFIFLTLAFYFWKINSDWQETAPLARFHRFSLRFLRYFKNLILVFIIGYGLVYAVYFLFTVNYPITKQVSDTEFILTSFSDGPDPNWQTCKLNSDINLKRRTRCLAEINIWMAQDKILRPMAQYLLGILMVFQRSAGGNTAYFLGEVSASGWWYYFPVVFVLKEPLPSLILIGLALLLVVWGILKKIRVNPRFYLRGSAFMDYLGTHFPEFSMISFVVFYWLYSINSPLNIGIRHILPTMPFIYILTASAIKKWIRLDIAMKITEKNFWKKLIMIIKNLLFGLLKSILIAVLIAWYFFETFFNTPYYLSYFNQFAGGTENGYKYVVDSNYDWGQDLKRLKNFVENPPAGEKIQKIAVDYFGGGNPKYYLGDNAEYWHSVKGNPKKQGIKWLAVSVNTLQGALAKLHPGQLRNPQDEYRWLKEVRNLYQPDARIGTSIFVYKL